MPSAFAVCVCVCELCIFLFPVSFVNELFLFVFSFALLSLFSSTADKVISLDFDYKKLETSKSMRAMVESILVHSSPHLGLQPHYLVACIHPNFAFFVFLFFFFWLTGVA